MTPLRRARPRLRSSPSVGRGDRSLEPCCARIHNPPGHGWPRRAPPRTWGPFARAPSALPAPRPRAYCAPHERARRLEESAASGAPARAAAGARRLAEAAAAAGGARRRAAARAGPRSFCDRRWRCTAHISGAPTNPRPGGARSPPGLGSLLDARRLSRRAARSRAAGDARSPMALFKRAQVSVAGRPTDGACAPPTAPLTRGCPDRNGGCFAAPACVEDSARKSQSH
jgi:hypothetical protein